MSTPSFSVPNADARLAAIGDTSGSPEALRRALTSLDAFEALSPPSPHDWLANHSERGQTYAQWARTRPNRPDHRRKAIYVQPFGAFEPGESPDLDRLQRFASAFFAMPVVAFPVQSFAQEFAAGRITTRRNHYGGQRQLLTSDILDVLTERLTGDAFALIGITMEDLYPDPTWNFVFGQASVRKRVAVYSFARYHPRLSGTTAGTDWRSLLFRRSCKVLAHETAHMFGIAHCIYFRCLMNGSNHLAESDARPMHLCPVDLRKLQDATAFDVADWYRQLDSICREFAFDDETRWLDKRLAALVGAARA